MNTSPITFIDHLHPELLSAWKARIGEGLTIKPERIHNLGQEKSSISLWTYDHEIARDIVCHIEVTNVPQKDRQSAMNCNIHLPLINLSKTLLMIFKDEAFYAEWTAKIILTISSMIDEEKKRAARAEASVTPPAAPTGTDVFSDPKADDPASPAKKTRPVVPPPRKSS